jgi:hypothetical protein
MPFMLLRATAVLAAGFLIAGPSHAAPGAARTGGATRAKAAIAPGQCPAHWTADDLPIPPPAAGASIQSVAVLSTTDAFALLSSYPDPTSITSRTAPGRSSRPLTLTASFFAPRKSRRNPTRTYG